MISMQAPAPPSESDIRVDPIRQFPPYYSSACSNTSGSNIDDVDPRWLHPILPLLLVIHISRGISDSAGLYYSQMKSIRYVLDKGAI